MERREGVEEVVWASRNVGGCGGVGFEGFRVFEITKAIVS